MLIGGTECSRGEGGAVARSEHSGTGRIGPEDARAVVGPQPDRQGAACVNRKVRITNAPDLKFGFIDRHGSIERSQIAKWLGSP